MKSTTVLYGEASSKRTEIKRRKDCYMWSRLRVCESRLEDRGAHLEMGIFTGDKSFIKIFTL